MLQRIGNIDVDVDVAEEEDLALAELWVLGDKLLFAKATELCYTSNRPS